MKNVITEYAGYDVTSDGDYILFGCGDVTVLRSDLRAMAKIVKKKKFCKLISSLPNSIYSSEYSDGVDFNDFIENLSIFVELETCHKNDFDVLIRLLKDSDCHMSIRDLMNIPSTTYIGLSNN